jgi:hypothetical protein
MLLTAMFLHPLNVATYVRTLIALHTVMVHGQMGQRLGRGSPVNNVAVGLGPCL